MVFVLFIKNRKKLNLKGVYLYLLLIKNFQKTLKSLPRSPGHESTFSWPILPRFACARVIRVFAPVPATSGNKENATPSNPIPQPNFQPAYGNPKGEPREPKKPTPGRAPKQQLMAIC